MAVLAKIPVRMSVEEFLNWDSGDTLKYELVDGEPRAMAPANRTHGILQGRLATLINNHLDREQCPHPSLPRERGREGRPCSVVVEPGVVPRLLSDHNLRVPDLAVTCVPYETEEAVLALPGDAPRALTGRFSGRGVGSSARRRNSIYSRATAAEALQGPRPRPQ